jgi:hypothetical protein
MRPAIPIRMMHRGSRGGLGSFETAATMATVPPTDDYERARAQERVDVAILRALGERRALRALRTPRSASAWDGLERLVHVGATLIWETSSIPRCVSEDLLAYCAFLARELEVTESLDLEFEAELERLQALAPRAIAALDAIWTDLDDYADARSLDRGFAAIRAELTAALRLAWASAA